MKSRRACVCCKKSRGYIYAGPVFSEGEYHKRICPWCIADGSARKKLDVTFFTEDAVGGNGDWVRVPRSVVQEITCRTPGFSGWQQEQWWTHCKDAGRYLGKAGMSELKTCGADAIEAIRSYIKYDAKDEKLLMSSLDKDGSPTAYVFQCMKCGKHGGYWDCD